MLTVRYACLAGGGRQAGGRRQPGVGDRWQAAGGWPRAAGDGRRTAGRRQAEDGWAGVNISVYLSIANAGCISASFPSSPFPYFSVVIQNVFSAAVRSSPPLYFSSSWFVSPPRPQRHDRDAVPPPPGEEAKKKRDTAQACEGMATDCA